VLAVVAEPPEVYPGETARLQAVVAWPLDSTDASTSGVDVWSYCTEPRVPGTHGTAPGSCLTDSVVLLAGASLDVEALLPTNACRNFGPDPPTDDFRPQDPDVTGGYYQPVRLDAFGQFWFHFQRLRCPLANTPTTIAKQFIDTYTPNKNPTPSQVEVNGSVYPFKGPFHVQSFADEASLSVTITWSSDPGETYPHFDPESRELESVREDVQVTWFTNAGELSYEAPNFSSKRSRQALATWAPTGDGDANLWTVIRDSRGGTVALRLDLVR
jgi:hypothetical protein